MFVDQQAMRLDGEKVVGKNNPMVLNEPIKPRVIAKKDDKKDDAKKDDDKKDDKKEEKPAAKPVSTA